MGVFPCLYLYFHTGPEGPHVNYLILVLSQIMLYEDKMLFLFIHVVYQPALLGLNDSPAVHTGEALLKVSIHMSGTRFSWPPGGSHYLLVSYKVLVREIVIKHDS